MYDRRVEFIETCHGNIETPCFFPVNNFGKKGKPTIPEYWKDIPDLKNMLINAFTLKKSEQFKKILQKGLHGHYTVNGKFFVDSGGFQARGQIEGIDPLEILRIQEKIGADIASTLDIPVFPEDSILFQTHSDHIRKSVKYALKSIQYRQNEDMNLFAAIHGNEPAMMTNMINYLEKKAHFDGYAIGGLVPKRSNFYQIINLIHAVRKRVDDRPLHVFGLGGPSMIPLMVYLGVDSFDSSSFILAGSHRVYFSPDIGSQDMGELPQREMLPCVCPVCSKHTMTEIRNNRKLIALHNLWMITLELRRLRAHIEDKTLEDYLNYRFIHNPLISQAYRYAKMKVRGLV